MTLNKLIQVVVCLTIVLMLTIPSAVAKKNSLGFDDSVSYDIYFQGVDGYLSVVYDVEIVDMTQLNTLKFLVIRSAQFNLKNSEGYILFDSIKAILPNRAFKVQNTSGFKTFTNSQ